MSKTGERLITAAKEAAVIAKCDHDLIPQPHLGAMKKFYCSKCRATIWQKPFGGLNDDKG